MLARCLGLACRSQRDARQFPERDFKTAKDFARTDRAALDVLFRDTAEAEPLGMLFTLRRNHGRLCGERAVEIENDKR